MNIWVDQKVIGGYLSEIPRKLKHRVMGSYIKKPEAWARGKGVQGIALPEDTQLLNRSFRAFAKRVQFPLFNNNIPLWPNIPIQQTPSIGAIFYMDYDLGATPIIHFVSPGDMTTLSFSSRFPGTPIHCIVHVGCDTLAGRLMTPDVLQIPLAGGVPRPKLGDLLAEMKRRVLDPRIKQPRERKALLFDGLLQPPEGCFGVGPYVEDLQLRVPRLNRDQV